MRPLFYRKWSSKCFGVLVVRRSWSSNFVSVKTQLLVVQMAECIHRVEKHMAAVAVAISL